MRRTARLSTLVLLAGVSLGCFDDGGTGGTGGSSGTGGTGFETFVSFSNVIVGDGIESTNIAVEVNGVEVETDLPYQNAGGRRNIEMPSQVADIPAEMRLTFSGRVLNPGATIPLRAGPPFSVYGVGNIDTDLGPEAPAFVTLEALGQPVEDTFRVRAIHALAGFSDALDVYANGVMFASVQYATGSEPLDIAAGAPGTDSLIVTEAGVPPNEMTDLFRISGASLFAADSRYDLVVSHESDNFNGDINGAVTVWIAEIGE